MNSLGKVSSLVIRYGLLWFVDTVSIIFTAWLLPGVNLLPTPSGSTWTAAAAAAFMLAIVNLLIRPLILLLALPLGFFVIFVIGFFVNALTLLITSALLPYLEVQGFGAAIVGGLVMALINTVVTSVLTADDDDSFFQGLAERLARRDRFTTADEQTRGLVILEIDGLSYWHMKQALAEGLMPHTRRLLDEQGYELTRIDCGIPSQTSSSQAGFLFGDNYDIPAFRWYDKQRGRTFVSGKDATEINSRYALGNGLLRGGSSINNMLDGDAEKSLLTLANLRTGTPEEKKRRARDIYLLMIRPYFIMRTIVLMLGDALLEIWQYLGDVRRDVQPRLNRLGQGYPLLRAATTVFMRDVAESLVMLDMVRGSPVIYATWPGYDHVAHYTGPSTTAALGLLRTYDQTVARVLDVIRRKAPRPYELIILSDHGQSFGATFKQRYGYNLKGFIEQHIPSGTTVSQFSSGDDGGIAMAAVAGELENMTEQDVGGMVGQAVAESGQKLIEAGMKPRERSDGAETAAVTVYGSGNLAPVYFHFSKERVTRNALEQQYPGLFRSLVEHEGVGLVLAYEDDGAPVIWGKSGSRNLRTDELDGQDPLTPYGDPQIRAQQLARLAGFPSNGDLTVFSTLYPDGTVAAMEEQIGSHGGIGGPQTDAFLLHPGDMEIPPILNSADLFHVLDARRGMIPPPRPVEPAAPPEDGAWTPHNLRAGIAGAPRWLRLAGRAILLRLDAYREAAHDTLMTGPALLISVIAILLQTLTQPGGFVPVVALQLLARLIVMTLLFLVTGRLITTGRLKAQPKGAVQFTHVFRAVGLAQSVYIVQLLAFIPGLASFALVLGGILSTIADWVAANTTFDVRGWRTLLFPLAVMVVVLVIAGVSMVLLRGAALTLTSLGIELGVIGP